jgi:AMP nucleosidase
VPGTYAATITRPDLFRSYLIQQIGLLMRNHGVPVIVGPSDTPMPVHFAVATQPDPERPARGVLDFSLARCVRRAGSEHHQR